MLTLYVKTGCPFCAKVLATGTELGISFEEKNIADDAVAAELIARGGKRQVPYLIDSEKGVEMYESDDIVAYLRGGKESMPKSSGVCNPF
jgi:glutaredoxin